uniref:transmembrane protein 238-like n=1 Tax=Euleptes europaea TaxID=460621 RepID=UPI0025420793|nr:transmembrane protein 238-like [Euleptes europaea]
MGRAWGGRCAAFLALALALDAAGLALVLAGAVGKPALDGSSLEDFLVLSGALLLLFSLLFWLFWYSCNLRGVPAEELPLGARAPRPRGQGSLGRLAAKLSERLSQRPRRAPAPSLPPDPGPSARAPSRSARPSSPLQLGHLRPAARPEQGPPQERLV